MWNKSAFHISSLTYPYRFPNLNAIFLNYVPTIILKLLLAIIDRKIISTDKAKRSSIVSNKMQNAGRVISQLSVCIFKQLQNNNYNNK